MAKKIFIRKAVEVEVEVETKIEVNDLIDSLQDEDELEYLLEEYGFIKKKDVGIGSSIIDAAKVELIKELMEKATLNQLEIFSKSL